MKQIIDFLHNLGLSEAEIKIYVKLLELGRVSITELAHSLGMNRVTAHFNIQSLIDQGLIAHVKQGRSRELYAQPPEALKYLIEQRDQKLQELHAQYAAAMPLLTGMMPSVGTEHAKFDVKFYQGINGVRTIYNEVLKAKEVRSYVKVSSIGSILPENIPMFSSTVHQKEMKLWEIIEDSPKSREYVKSMNPARYNYKYFPSQWDISVFDYMIFDGKVAMVAGEKTLNGIIIINDDIYESAKVLFEMFWNLLPDPLVVEKG